MNDQHDYAGRLLGRVVGGGGSDGGGRTTIDAGDRRSDLLTLRGLWFVFKRKLALFSAVALAVLSVVVFFTFQMTPTYVANASVIIDPDERELVDFADIVQGLPPDQSVVETEVQLMRSRELAARVVDRLDLTADPEFNHSLAPPGTMDKLTGRIRNLIGAVIPLSDGPVFTEEERRARDHSRSIDAVLNVVSVGRRGETFVIDVWVTSVDPQKAADIANAFVNEYLTDQLEGKLENLRRANSWLAERLESLRQEVETNERAVENYRSEAGLLDAAGASLTEQNVADLTAQAVVLRGDLAENEARLNAVLSSLSSGARGEDVAEVLASPLIATLRAQQADITREQSDLEVRYGERHPEMQRVRRELSEISSEIDAEVQRIVSSLRSEVSIARQRVSSVERDVARLRGELSANNSALVRLRELERNATASRTLFENFLDRFKETNERDQIQQPDARVIAKATAPLDPAAPNKKLNFALGLFLGIFTGVGVVFLAEALDPGFRAAADVEQGLGVPCLALLPKVRNHKKYGGPANYVLEKPLSSYAESLRALRAHILYDRGRGPVKVVAITSAMPGEGKTTSALSLARVSAMLGRKTLVVDADVRRPILTETSVLAPTSGLEDLLSGEADLEQAIVQEERSGLHILPLTSEEGGSAELLSKPDLMRNLLERLRERYDLVIVDTSPILPVAETRVLATMVDTVVVLAKWRKTPLEVVRDAVDALQRVGANVAGVALTQVNMEAVPSSYGYAGKQSKGYLRYYQD